MTYTSGAAAGQFPVLSTATVSMVPVNDKVNAGVDWTLTCGGSPLAPPVSGGTSVGCGTVLPFHTASGVSIHLHGAGADSCGNRGHNYSEGDKRPLAKLECRADDCTSARRCHDSDCAEIDGSKRDGTAHRNTDQRYQRRGS